jgi:hypothetical protein
VEFETEFSMIAGELACMAEEDMQLVFRYCVHCAGRGPIGTFCDRCVDSGCIYVAERFEDKGRGEYWENSNDEGEDDEEFEEESKLDSDFELQVLNNETIVLLRAEQNGYAVTIQGTQLRVCLTCWLLLHWNIILIRSNLSILIGLYLLVVHRLLIT